MDNINTEQKDQVSETKLNFDDFNFESVTKQERVFAGKSYTLDGLADIWINGDKTELSYPETPEFKGYPKKWREKHAQGFSAICFTIDDIKNRQEKRKVPLLMQEVLETVDKEVAKDLERMGFISTKLVQLMEEGKRLGGRVIVWITPEGQALKKELNLY